MKISDFIYLKVQRTIYICRIGKNVFKLLIIRQKDFKVMALKAELPAFFGTANCLRPAAKCKQPVASSPI